MSINIDDESKWLTTIVLPEVLSNGRLVDNYNAELRNTFRIIEIRINQIGVEEAYMLTQCYRATIDFEYAGDQQHRKFVVKKTPKVSTEVYDSVQFHDLFHNEINFYTEILPVIQKMSNGKFTAPKYYYSEIKPNSALIVLGDFAADGWSVTKDRVGLSLEHARIAVKYIGKLHGFGYAMKLNETEHFQEITSQFREARFDNNNLNREWSLRQKATLRRAEKAVELYQPQVEKEFVHKFQKLVFNYKRYGRQRVAPREPFSTLCHGDYLRNNLAYKYEAMDNSGEPLDIMMFDYQTMRLSSPMVDLTLFLALSLFADIRHKYFDILFDDYCNSLFESYKSHSKQPLPAFLNREDLLKEYIKFLPYAVSITCYFLFCLVEPAVNSAEEMFNRVESDDDIILTAMTQGGEVVDREIAHQIREMFDLSREHNIQIDEDIDTKDWIDAAISYFS